MSDEFKLQWSVSLAPVAQYAKGHMFNFRGNSVAELEALFDEVLQSETIEKALEVASMLTAVDAIQTALPQNDRPAVQAVPDQGASVTELRTCAHGKRQYKEGTNKNTGKAWSGWFCPERNKSAQCDVDWA